MCTLELFPPPVPLQVTLCEANNELLTGPKTKELPNQDDCPPILHFPRESFRLHIRTESGSQGAFLDNSETLWMRSAAAWRDGGITGLLKEIVTSHTNVPKCLSVASGGLLTLLRKISSFHTSLYPHLTLSSEDMIAEFSQVLNWSDGVVRGFAWHPHTNKYAVALLDDSVKIYNPKSSATPSLKHRLQRNIAAVQWKPLCASALAVASQSCLLVWHVDPSSLSARPSSGCVQILSQPGHSPVTSISWSPSGSLLVSASPVDTAMMVWDVAAESCVPLQRVGGGGVSFLSWSPDGSHVLASTPSALFRVWETKMWTCERWPCKKGRCQSGCWSPDGRQLLFTVQGDALIYALTFIPEESIMHSRGPELAVVVGNLSETTFNTPQGDVVVGGEIQSLTWDPKGQRLAVLLKGNPQADNQPAIIAVFKTRLRPVFELLPCGFIQGEQGVEPRLIQFHSSFHRGALLSVCWSNGKITHVPFFFLSEATPIFALDGSPSISSPENKTPDFNNRSLFTEMIS